MYGAHEKMPTMYETSGLGSDSFYPYDVASLETLQGFPNNSSKNFVESQIKCSTLDM